MEMGTITRRMDNVRSELEIRCKHLYSREHFEKVLQELEKMQNTSARAFKLKELYDMLDAAGVPYPKNATPDAYRKIIRAADLPDFTGIEAKILRALFDTFQAFPKPEEYMLRLVNRFANPEDGWENDSLRLRILKQFIKYGDCLRRAKYKGNVRKLLGAYLEGKGVSAFDGKRGPMCEDALRQLDDGIFAYVETQPGEGRNAITVADDLASGKFRTNCATVKDLYMFAMVYGMTYYAGRNDEIRDYGKDIEKNLFADYYTNNLIRFLSSAYMANCAAFEQDPTGRGINYKNFAEMIYLYYIRRADLRPAEKISRSTKMIEQVKKEASAERNARYGQDTTHYRNLVVGGDISTDVFSLDETEFCQFILENYSCNTCVYIPGLSKPLFIGDLELGGEQNTAYDVYQDLIGKLDQMLVEDAHPMKAGQTSDWYMQVYRCNCNYGLWFTDAATIQKKRDIFGPMRTAEEAARLDAFLDLLQRTNRFIGITAAVETESKRDGAGEKKELTCREREERFENESRKLSSRKTDALFVDSPKAVTRRTLVVAFYYYFNYRSEKRSPLMSESFGEFFERFKEELDTYLVPAGYTSFEWKNLLDVMIALSAYSYGKM